MISYENPNDEHYGSKEVVKNAKKDVEKPSGIKIGGMENFQYEYNLSDEFIPHKQNIVSTASLDCKLNLGAIVQNARNAEYNPRRFGAVIMRIREPKTTALIFSSGKIVCTGAKTEDDSRIAARKFGRIIQKLSNSDNEKEVKNKIIVKEEGKANKVSFKEFMIQNIVASSNVGFHVPLERLQNNYSHFSTYEPELFPGLIFRILKPKVVLLIFVSGKIVLTGAKTESDIGRAYEYIYPVLKEVFDERQKYLNEIKIKNEPFQ